MQLANYLLSFHTQNIKIYTHLKTCITSSYPYHSSHLYYYWYYFMMELEPSNIYGLVSNQPSHFQYEKVVNISNHTIVYSAPGTS